MNRIVIPLLAMIIASPLLAAPAFADQGYGTAVAPAPPSAGQWIYRTQRVWVPGRVVGYDVYRRPIISAGYWAAQVVPVWEPAPVVYVPAPVIRRVYYRPAPLFYRPAVRVYHRPIFRRVWFR